MAKRLYKGIVVLEDQIEEIESMDIRDDDIWVCTFPRSGIKLYQYNEGKIALLVKIICTSRYFS